MKLLVLSLLWLFFCISHSFLISNKVHGYVQANYPGLVKYYRILYNIFSGLIFLIAAAYGYYIADKPFFVFSGYYQIISVGMIIIALLIFIAGSIKYDLKTFAGISQLITKQKQILVNDTNMLTITGIHKYIRHPYYTATFLLIWSRNLDMSALITNLILSLYLVVGTYLEEKKLTDYFGETYRIYKKNVSMYIPLKYIKKTIIKPKD